MSDRVIFPLADGWALGTDDIQWILLRARNRHAETVWQPVAFIASTKSILRRCMAESGVQLTPTAEGRFDALPEQFRDWLLEHVSDTKFRSAA